MAAALLPLQQLQVQQLRAESWESEVILLLHIYCNHFSIYLNNIDSPVDVGGFAEPRKILSQCAFPLRLSNYQYTPGPRKGVPESPTGNSSMDKHRIKTRILSLSSFFNQMRSLQSHSVNTNDWSLVESSSDCNDKHPPSRDKTSISFIPSKNLSGTFKPSSTSNNRTLSCVLGIPTGDVLIIAQTEG